MSDELNNADVRALVAALHGVRQDLSDIKTKLDTSSKQIGFQDRAHTHAIDKLAAKLDRLADRVENSLKLNREVVGQGREALEVAVERIDESAKHLLLPKERVMSQVKTVWFVFWVAQLITTAVAASGALPMGAWLKLLLALSGVFTTIATFLAAQWKDPAKEDAPALPADASSR